MLKYGVDRAAEFAHLFTGRVGLVTAPTGRNSRGQTTASVLREICDLQLLFAPEHGIRGDRAAGEIFGAERDPETGLEVLSLYSGESKRLPRQVFDRLDTVVYDIQDVGCRFYTFISTLKNLAEDCAAFGKRLIVLDRPNPLGDRVEGTLLLKETISFVGCHDIPVCYGLTCGEFARMVNAEENLHCDLQIIPCEDWHRDMAFPAWGKEWVRPSPNIPDYETALLYPGTCLIEGTNLSEGRGTDAPLVTLGAPFVDGNALCRAFRELGLPGVQAQPVRFTPTLSKHAGKLCGGIRLSVTNVGTIRPNAMGVTLLKLLERMYPADFRYIPGEGQIPFVSQLAGHREFERPDWELSALLRKADADAKAFRVRKACYHIY